MPDFKAVNSDSIVTASELVGIKYALSSRESISGAFSEYSSKFSNSFIHKAQKGTQRSHDIDLLKEILKFIEAAKKFPVQIAEIGCGTTVGRDSDHYGCSWISRTLKKHYGDLVDIVVTDMTRSYGLFNVFWNNSKGDLEVKTFLADGMELSEASIEALCERDRKPKKISELQLEDNFLEKIKNDFEVHVDCNAALMEGNFFIRYALDSYIEAKYGLRVLDDVDASDPQKLPFAPDIVFARHMPPTPELFDQMCEKVPLILGEDGVCLLGFDPKIEETNRNSFVILR